MPRQKTLAFEKLGTLNECATSLAEKIGCAKALGDEESCEILVGELAELLESNRFLLKKFPHFAEIVQAFDENVLSSIDPGKLGKLGI